MPYLTQVAIGTSPYLNSYGFDYPTHYGTGVRDYIHVMDLADVHVPALSKASALMAFKSIIWVLEKDILF